LLWETADEPAQKVEQAGNVERRFGFHG
jgi:hypothetical protein